MTKYLVPVTFEFDGNVMVEAKLEEGNLTFDKECIDQVIYNPSGYPVVRDNESVEEREEGDEEI